MGETVGRYEKGWKEPAAADSRGSIDRRGEKETAGDSERVKGLPYRAGRRLEIQPYGSE